MKVSYGTSWNDQRVTFTGAGRLVVYLFLWSLALHLGWRAAALVLP